MLCSCTMIAGRDEADVIKNELGTFFLSKGNYKANYEDSSATGNVMGLAKQKAIYRKGLGCTLIAEMSETELRNQKLHVTPTPSIDTDTIPWPMGDRLPSSVTINKKLQRAVASAFEEPSEKKLRRTRAIIVIYDGMLVAEQYAKGYDRHSLHIGWSMSKSITSALIGILVQNKKLNIHTTAPISEWQHDGRQKITISNLLHASSGLEWNENYSSPSTATNMLYKKKDMGGFAASQPLEFEPETVFEYSSGTSNILSKIIRQTVGNEMYASFPSEALFSKLGMYSMVMEPDASGTFVGSSYSFATARDWGRFGLLYINKGNWLGEQIISEDWVRYTTTPAPAALRGEYGAQFWLNSGERNNPSNRYYPDAPVDLFWADGYEGQNVFIISSKKLVIVKLSLSQGDYLDDNKFLHDVIEAL